MAIFKITGFLPVHNSIIMKQHQWYIESDFFEEAIDKACKYGARNIFKIEQINSASANKYD